MEVVVAVVAAVVGVAIGLVVGLRRKPAHDPLEDRPDRSPVAGDVVEALPVEFAVLDTADHVVTLNARAEGSHWVRRGEIVDDSVRSTVREARRLGRTAVSEVEQPRAFKVTAVPVEQALIAVVVEDLTAARRVEEVRRDFVANVSHELKTPLGALSLLSEAVKEAADDPPAVRRFAERIGHESTRLGRLVQDLIELSRLQTGQLGPESAWADLDAVVEEAVDRLREPAVAKRIVIAVGGDTGLKLQGDSRQLTTALSNLLDNAVAYSPEGTQVAVGVRRVEGAVELSVTDQGEGVPQAEQHRIFERFYRVDPARSRETGGTGLGLAIVKHVASNHGGSIAVWSRQGFGSTFTLRLPTADPEEAV